MSESDAIASTGGLTSDSLRPERDAANHGVALIVSGGEDALGFVGAIAREDDDLDAAAHEGAVLLGRFEVLSFDHG